MGTYSGVKFGAIQDAVYDQMGTALEGQLANQSDYNLVDHFTAGEDLPICRAVVSEALSGAPRAGVNDEVVKLPTSATTADAIEGFTVLNHAGRTNADNVNYYQAETQAGILRLKRVGGRIHVKAQTAATRGGNVHVVIAGDTYPLGSVAGAAIENETVELTKAKFKHDAAAGDLVLVELG